jgi:uncharacterized protein YcnI
MNTDSLRGHARRRSLVVPALAVLALLVTAASASAHARVSPPVSLSGKLQLYSLAVPTEKAGLTTSKIVLTVPSGFGIDSFVPPPAGWRQVVQSTGTGDDAIVERVTWTGGHTPTGDDSLFQFLAQPAKAQTYTFQVMQTYSDGSIVSWAGSESSAAPAPSIVAKTSLGGGGTPLITIIALIVGILALIAAGFALVSRAGGGGDGSGEGAGGRALA